MSPHRADSPFTDLSRWDDIFLNIDKYIQGYSDYVNRVDLDLEY